MSDNIPIDQWMARRFPDGKERIAELEAKVEELEGRLESIAACCDFHPRDWSLDTRDKMIWEKSHGKPMTGGENG